MVRATTIILLIAVSIATVVILVGAGGPSTSRVGLALFVAWALSPYAALAWLSSRPLNPWVLLAGAVLIGASALLFYYDGFVRRPDPQSGLLVLFLPLWQLIACVVVGLIALRLSHRSAS